MKSKSKTLKIKSEETLQFIDITKEVKDFVEQSQIRNGLLNIQTKHTTATVFLNENEPLLLKDMKKNLERLAPANENYNHDDFSTRTVNMCEGECDNGHSHCKALYLPSSITLNVENKEINLGTWQSLMFVELDRAREREIHFQLIGE